mgnify:CR=1 FL=1|jgi:hypothetical protein
MVSEKEGFRKRPKGNSWNRYEKEKKVHGSYVIGGRKRIWDEWKRDSSHRENKLHTFTSSYSLS